MYGSCCSIYNCSCSVLFCMLLTVFLSFLLFEHCIVCPSIYGFWLTVWNLQTFLGWHKHEICISLFVLYFPMLLIYFRVQSYTLTQSNPLRNINRSLKYILTLKKRFVTFIANPNNTNVHENEYCLCLI